ncbi:hypothetical protein MMC29_001456, partial [Sticta canariensis]|nr:hypothetical protein [Sticta canariensis]
DILRLFKIPKQPGGPFYGATNGNSPDTEQSHMQGHCLTGISPIAVVEQRGVERKSFMLETVHFAKLYETWGHENTVILVLLSTAISAIIADPEALAFVAAVVQTADLRVLKIWPRVFWAQNQREPLTRFHLHIRGSFTTLRPIAPGFTKLVAVDRVKVPFLDCPTFAGIRHPANRKFLKS